LIDADQDLASHDEEAFRGGVTRHVNVFASRHKSDLYMFDKLNRFIFAVALLVLVWNWLFFEKWQIHDNLLEISIVLWESLIWFGL
jgi:hypothetical protein